MQCTYGCACVNAMGLSRFNLTDKKTKHTHTPHQNDGNLNYFPAHEIRIIGRVFYLKSFGFFFATVFRLPLRLWSVRYVARQFPFGDPYKCVILVSFSTIFRGALPLTNPYTATLYTTNRINSKFTVGWLKYKLFSYQ